MSTTIHMTSNRELYPDTNNTGTLGTSSYYWNALYATNLHANNLTRGGQSSSWINGRDNALLKVNSLSGYSPAISIKTTNGSWEIGAYNHESFTDKLTFAWCSDTNYNNSTNSSAVYTLSSDGTFSGTVANADTLDGNHASAFAAASHSHSYLPLSGGTMTGTINYSANTIACNFRPDHSGYYTTISYQTSGNEALVFATKTAVTSFLFINGEDTISNLSSSRWYECINGVQIKNNCVAIGGGWGSDVTPNYRLKVTGDVYYSGTMYLGTSSGIVIRDSAANWILGKDDASTGAIHLGSTAFAQEVRIENSAGKLTVNGSGYGVCYNTFLPSSDNSYNLGSSSNYWKEFWLKGAIHCYKYVNSNSLPVFIADKPGSYYWGFGPDGTSNMIRFGPVSDISGSSWVATGTFNSNRWYFQGDLQCTNRLTVGSGSYGSSVPSAAYTGQIFFKYS